MSQATQTISQSTHDHNWLEIAGRVGYATKGVVYCIVGGLAAAAAWNAGGETTGSEGAISKIGQQPFGEFLLWLVAIGLVGYCIWRLFEAIADPDGKGSDAVGLLARGGYAVSGLAYGLLAWKAAPWGGSSSAGESSNVQQGLVAQALSLPLGKWLVAAVGVIIVLYGVYQIYRAFSGKFTERYDTTEMSHREQQVARYAGQFGLTARGITFGIIGGFVVVAAVTLDPSRMKGVGGALDVLAQQSYGSWVLLLVGLGLFCFGFFCLVQARYRSFDQERAAA